MSLDQNARCIFHWTEIDTKPTGSIVVLKDQFIWPISINLYPVIGPIVSKIEVPVVLAYKEVKLAYNKLPRIKKCPIWSRKTFNDEQDKKWRVRLTNS